MGLDSVELVMAIEEEFGVELKDDECCKAVTPRLVTDLVFSKLRTTDEKTCQTQRAFYVLRRALRRVLGLKRSQVTLDLPIRQFIPQAREKELWPKLGTAVAARSWPKLERPRWVSNCMQAACLAAFAAAVALSVRFHLGVTVGVIAGLIILIPFAALLYRFTRPLEVCIPARYRTVRDLVPAAVASEFVLWTREQVATRVKQVVMEQLGVPERKYTEDSRFVDDFGMD